MPSRTRAPVVLAVVVGILLMAGALFVHSAIARAAKLAVRGQGGELVEKVRTSIDPLPRPLQQADLERIRAARAGDRLTYLGMMDPNAAVAIEAGQPVGSGWEVREPRRFGARVRVVLPPPPGDARVLAFEFEPSVANDIFMAGQLTILVVAGLDVVLIALGFLFARAMRSEDALVARLEGERRLAALGEMSAVLAHELRNPLTSLKGHAQLLAEVLPEGSAQKTKADRVVNESVRLERLTNDLLEFVRTGALRLRSIDPRDVVEAAIASVDGTPVAARYAPSLSPIRADVDRLAMALANLLRNANESDGKAPIEVTVGEDDTGVTITIRDHGPGIPAGDEEAIFLPFRTSKTRGTGLGLPTARRIVELHGGTIVASNHEAGGAMFRLTIPRERG